MRIERLRSTYEVDVCIRHFPLHPETPPGGVALEQLFAGRGVDVEAMNQRMSGLMAREGLPYGSRTHTYNSRLAQELASWAVGQVGGWAIHDALYRAYFVDGLDIGDPERLVAVAESVGLSPTAARAVLAERSYRDAVDRDWARSRALGVTGVPTFVANGYAVVGAQPYEVLEELIVRAGGEEARSSDP